MRNELKTMATKNDEQQVKDPSKKNQKEERNELKNKFMPFSDTFHSSMHLDLQASHP